MQDEIKYQNHPDNGREDPETESVFQEQKELLEELFEKTEGYILDNVELMRLKVLDQVADSGAALMANGIILILGLGAFALLNFGLGFWLGEILGYPHLGFFLIGGFYTLLTIVLLLFKESILVKSFRDSIISHLLKDKTHESSDPK